MKLDKKIKPFENLLLAYISNDSIVTNNDKEAEIVFSKNFSATLSKEKSNILVSSLIQSLSEDTLGSIVEKSLRSDNHSFSELQQKTGLTPSLLEAIKFDMIFTNSIPVKSLVKLLKFLNISLEKAQISINKTFEKLSTESKMFLSVPIKVQPSYRKDITHSDTGLNLMLLKTDESYLYQNKEALDKYTTRLNELYNEL